MVHASIEPQTQDGMRILDKIDDFFSQFKIASTLHRCGIRKMSRAQCSLFDENHFYFALCGKELFPGHCDVKLVFVRDRRKKDWLALMCTDLDLANEDIVRIYGKRWDIEVFFKMAKQHLKLTKEIQCRDYDALIAHTSIVFMRYMFLAYQCRIETDHRTFGEMFYACFEEMADISFIEALHRIMTLAGQRLRQIGSYCEKTASAMFDTIIETALECVGLSKNNGMKFTA